MVPRDPNDELLRISIGNDGTGVVVWLAGEMDVANCDRVSRCLLHLVGTSERVVVDLTALAFIDCASLRVLIEAQRIAQQRGATVTLRHPRGVVARVLGLAELDEVFTVEA